MQIGHAIIAKPVSEIAEGRFGGFVVNVVQLAKWRQAHADTICSQDRCRGLFHQQPRPVSHGAAKGIGASVGAALDELIDQIALSCVEWADWWPCRGCKKWTFDLRTVVGSIP